MKKKSEMFFGQIQDIKNRIIEEIKNIYNEKSDPETGVLELDHGVEVVENDDTVELNHTITAINENSVFFGSPYFDGDKKEFTEFNAEFLCEILKAVEQTV